MVVISATLLIGVSALCTAIVTFFTTKSIYDTNKKEDQIKEINNQLIIQSERDNSHEFSQTIILTIFAIILLFILFTFCMRFCFNYMRRQLNFNENLQQIALPIRTTNV